MPKALDPSRGSDTKGFTVRVPATGRRADMRIVDLCRRDGDKPAENRVFIDAVHFRATQGGGLLIQAAELSHR